jgi:hypothetical protein
MDDNKLRKYLEKISDNTVVPGDESNYLDSDPGNIARNLLNKVLPESIQLDRLSTADRKRQFAELPEQVGLSTSGITRAEEVLGRYAGKIANSAAKFGDKVPPTEAFFKQYHDSVPSYGLIDKIDSPRSVIPGDSLDTVLAKVSNKMKYEANKSDAFDRLKDMLAKKPKQGRMPGDL